MPIDLQRYELFKDKKIEKFMLLENQGHCNYNYLVLSENKKYLIREFKLKNDRKSEFKIQTLIAKKDIGATPLLLDEEKGLMICEFIEGVHKTKLSPQMLKKLALLLQKLHKTKHHKKIPSLQKYFSFKNKRIKQAFILLNKEPKELRLCHNDLHQKNILFGKNIKLIDWEYAGVNDLYFDLVSIVIEFKLTPKEESTFFKSYFKRKKINLKKIKAYKLVYKELLRIWFEKLDKGEL